MATRKAKLRRDPNYVPDVVAHARDNVRYISGRLTSCMVDLHEPNKLAHHIAYMLIQAQEAMTALTGALDAIDGEG